MFTGTLRKEILTSCKDFVMDRTVKSFNKHFNESTIESGRKEDAVIENDSQTNEYCRICPYSLAGARAWAKCDIVNQRLRSTAIPYQPEVKFRDCRLLLISLVAFFEPLLRMCPKHFVENMIF